MKNIPQPIIYKNGKAVSPENYKGMTPAQIMLAKKIETEKEKGRELY